MDVETSQRSLLSWGANSFGQLGHGTMCEECITPKQVALDHLSIKPEDILSVVGGANHSFLLTNDGLVFGCGSNAKGQLAELSKVETKFELIPSVSRYTIKQFASKWETSYAISKDGICIAWGPNSFNQQGLGKAKMEGSGGVNVISSRVKQVAPGLRHVLILKEDGSIYAAGDTKKGQLGRSTHTESLEKVSGLEGVVQIACGQNHNLALLDSGKIVGWGCNKFGQLVTKDVLFTSEPLVICDVPSTNIKLLCGWTHSGFLNEFGGLTNWGRNKYFQLGVEQADHEGGFHILKCKPFKDVEFGSEHCIGLTVGEEVVSWGWNEHGNCGVGHVNNVVSPTLLQIGSGRVIGAGAGQSFAVTSTY